MYLKEKAVDEQVVACWVELLSDRLLIRNPDSPLVCTHGLRKFRGLGGS